MQLEKLVMKDFVLLLAEWTVEQGQELLDTTDAPYVIVQRRKAYGEDLVDEYFYLIVQEEVVQLLRSASPNTTIREALDLHESGATPAMEASVSADNAPDRVVVPHSIAFSGKAPTSSPSP